MEITRKVLENIRDITFDKRVMLEKEIRKVMDLLNDECGLDALPYFFGNDYTSFDSANCNICFNIDEMLKKGNVKDVSTKDIIKKVNCYITSTILHEYFHYYQYLCGKDNLSYDEINKIYKDLYDNYTLLTKVVYNFMSYRMFNERSANLFAYQNMLRIIDKDTYEFYIAQYCYNLLEGYKKKLFSITSPVNRTNKLIGKETLSDKIDIPTDIKLFHGLPLTDEEYNDYITPIEDYGYKNGINNYKILSIRW